MGYFSNGSEGDAYEARYCVRCAHYGDESGPGCPVLMLHLVYNYEACNDKRSPLHVLIPRTSDGLDNEQCTMFIDRK